MEDATDHHEISRMFRHAATGRFKAVLPRSPKWGYMVSANPQAVRSQLGYHSEQNTPSEGPRHAQESHRQAPDAGAPFPIISCGGCAWLAFPTASNLRASIRPCVSSSNRLSRNSTGMRRSSRCSVWDLRAKAGPLTVTDTPLAAPRAFRHKAATPFAPAADGSVRGGFFARVRTMSDCPACAVEAPGGTRTAQRRRTSGHRTRHPAHMTKTAAAVSSAS